MTVPVSVFVFAPVPVPMAVLVTVFVFAPVPVPMAVLVSVFVFAPVPVPMIVSVSAAVLARSLPLPLIMLMPALLPEVKEKFLLLNI